MGFRESFLWVTYFWFQNKFSVISFDVKIVFCINKAKIGEFRLKTAFFHEELKAIYSHPKTLGGVIAAPSSH